MTLRTLTLCFLLVAAASSCGIKSPYYQKQEGIPKAAWKSSFQPEFSINVTDTVSPYAFYFLMRHDEAYPNANIWIRLNVKGPGDSTFRHMSRAEIGLADAEGKWLGRGMGGIWEHKVALAPAMVPQFKKSGVYHIRIEQIMREDPLPSVLNVGLNIERRAEWTRRKNDT